MKADIKDAFGVGCVFALMVFLVLTVQSWLVMLTVGALHHAAPAIPSLSFGASTWLVFLAYLLVWPASSSGKR